MKNVSKSFGKINKIILLGGSWLTAEFLKLLSEKEIEVILYTSLTSDRDYQCVHILDIVVGNRVASLY